MLLDLLVEPQIGQIVTITKGQLEGLQGVLVAIKASRFLIQPFIASEGVFVLVESSHCEGMPRDKES
jgi:hypothetical protein